MTLADFSIRQAVLVNLLFWLFILAGGVVYRLLPVDVYPDISLDEALIQTPYPGASPEDVEQLVTRKIEEELEDIAGITRIVSNSVYNLSNIFIKFDENLNRQDYEAAFQEVRTHLDRVTDLPAEAEEPILTRLTLSEVWPIVQVVLIDKGDVGERILREVALDLKDHIKIIDGIAKVKEVGIRDREIHILVDKLALEQYHLSLPEVAAILSSSNISIPGGNIQTGREEFTLRAVGDVKTPHELGEICILKSPDGNHVYLRDIAEITEDFERRLSIATCLGKDCMFLYIAKEHHADSITIRNNVADKLDEYRSQLPPGVDIQLFGDATQMISSRLGVLKKNLGVGLVLVFVILWMFIGARNSFLAIIGIPFAFLCAFIFMYFVNVSINAVSVFSLVLVSGLLVDDAIVVLENIYRHLQEGKPLLEAIRVGANEVTWPVVSSALTTAAAFLPLLIMTGVLGRFFSIIPKTVTVALLASLFECLIILPAHFVHWGPRGKKLAALREPKVSKWRTMGNRWGATMRSFYRMILERSLEFRYLGLAIIVGLAVCAYQAQRTLSVDLFPNDFPSLMVTFNVPPESSLEQTDRVCRVMVDQLQEFVDAGYITDSSAIAGIQWNKDNQMSQRPNIAQIWIGLEQAADDHYDPERVMYDIRQRLTTFVSNHPQWGVRNLKAWPVQDGPPVGKPVAIRIEHPDYAVAGEVARRMKNRLHSFTGVEDIADNLEIGQRELRLTLKEDAASEFGLTFEDVFMTLNGANDGFVVGTFKDHQYDEDVDIRLKYHPMYRSSEDQLLDIDIKTRTGAMVKLQQVAHLSYDQGYASHYRYNGKRSVVVTADVNSDVADAEHINRAIMEEFLPLAERDDQLLIVAEGQFKESHESFDSLFDAGVIAIGLMYLILAAQFRDYLHPLIILVSLLFGAMGMVFGLVWNGYSFSVVSGIALVGLFGIVVNDSIVLISFINEHRNEQSSLRESLIKASLIRMRPILLTTVTTVVGLLPMALGVGGYNKIWSPFATCICWGLTCATVMILLFLPPLYMILDDARNWYAKVFQRRNEDASVRPNFGMD